jgi:hypothetical protein
VLRDFTLQLVDPNNNSITSQEYLERALQIRGEKEEKKNAVRRGIRAAFANRDCVLMQRAAAGDVEEGFF